ncbi:hypothetical protein GCM10009682_39970 [Luedemannella flava]|uniref:Uncharacterized protein n=1 Tax=Luedemannella flava TaxID=349316 RepID=A0ABP4YFD4_9ACTN
MTRPTAFLLAAAAMRLGTYRGSDGFDQWFGIPRYTPDAAFKQGWGSDDDSGHSHTPTVTVAMQAVDTSVRISGVARDADAPSARLYLSVSVGIRRIARVRTDARHTFAIDFVGAPGRHTYVVRVEGVGPGPRTVSVSRTVVLVVPLPPVPPSSPAVAG